MKVEKTLAFAVKLLWATLAIGIIRSALEFTKLTVEVPMGFVIGVQVFTILFLGFFVFMISKKKNWARIIFLLLFIAGMPFSIMPLLSSLKDTPVSGVLGIAQIVFQSWGLFLLFTDPVKQNFKAKIDKVEGLPDV